LKIEHKEAEVTSNVPQAKKKTMTINVEGMPHIMATLTNLYNDPRMAVIREYFTNGVDAHIAAGNPAPVEVTLPTWDDPVYTVTDHGVGMSEWDIENIYSEYGASTKRDSNEQNGAFGLGCKSAFTITNQFTVISVKDGEKTTTLFSRSEAGSYESNVVNKVRVDAPNGTTVKIPVREHLSEFNSKAHQFFGFVAPGTALVDGKEPASSFVNGRHIKDGGLDIYLKPKSEGASYVIMGTVPYELSTEQIREALTRLDQKASVGFMRMVKYFTVPIGDVDLTPNREGLMFTDKTNAVIDKHLTFILNDLKSIAQEEIDAVATLDEFFELHKHWDDIINIPREYKGEPVPVRLELVKSAHTIERTSWGSTHHGDGHGLPLTPKNGYQTYGKRILVSGYAADAYKKVNAYIGNYMTAKGMASGTFFITDDEDVFTNKWVLMQDRFTIISGDDIIEVGREQRKKERLEAAKNGTTKKSAIKYPVLFVDEGKVKWTAVKEIESGTPFLDYSEVGGGASNLIKSTYRHMRDIGVQPDIISFFKSVTSAKKVVLLNASRTEKALTDRIKKTYNLSADVQTAAIVTEKMITDDVKHHHNILSSGWRSFMISSGLDKRVNDINDSKGKEIIAPEKTTVESYNKILHMKRVLNYLYFYKVNHMVNLDLDLDTQPTKELDKKYPLVAALDKYEVGNATDHVVKYLNLIHEETDAVSV